MSRCPSIMKWPQEICWGKSCERLQAFVLVAGALRGWPVDMIHCTNIALALHVAKIDISFRFRY